MTRGALYHHFLRDKHHLFAAVLDAEQRKLAATVAAAEHDRWRAMVAASNAFLDGCLDRAVRRIDAPAVIGLGEWCQADQSHDLGSMKAPIRAAIDQKVIEDQSVDACAHIIYGALHEAAMLIAHDEDKVEARRAVKSAVERLFEGLRRRPRIAE